MLVHTIGDSHSSWNGLSIQHHLGPRLCYTFGKEPTGCPFDAFSIPDGSLVVFCLGEIDCRCHVHKYQPYESTIDDIVEQYMKSIEVVTAGRNIHRAVFNVVPPVRASECWEHPEYPFRGTDEDRKTYVLHFNRKLKELCPKYGYLFVDVYDKYADEDGFLVRALSDGTLHIGDTQYILEFLHTVNV